MDVYDRFASHVDTVSSSPCWVWVSSTSSVGMFSLYPNSVILATYASLILYTGVDVPSGMRVYHTCNRRNCVNPEHLTISVRFGRSVNYPIRKRQDVSVRFWRYVDKCGDDGCWEWTGGLDRRGYGEMNINRHTFRSHRVSWELRYGDIPDGLSVLHTCDNRKCVNPSHLFLGTQADNVRDMVEKGRMNTSGKARGERHGNSKLTNADVVVIRRDYRLGISGVELSKRYGVSKSVIFSVVTERTWKHVG